MNIFRRITLATLAGVMRLAVVIAAAGGYWMTSLHGSLEGLYWIVAASYAAFGLINAYAMASGAGWGRRLAAADALQPAR